MVVMTRRPSGYYLRHEAFAKLRAQFAAEGGPRKHILVADGHLLLHRYQRVEALIVLRTVKIHAQRLAIA